jgi:hypothetical protein
MTMIVTVVCVAMVKCHDTDKIHYQTSHADSQQFAQSMDLTSRGKPLHSFVNDLNTYDPG